MNKMTGEQISALADGELGDQQLEVALAALRDDEKRADWEVYHQIGDVLRSEDMAIRLSSGFAARMAARLEAEPTIITPVHSVRGKERQISNMPQRAAKRWAIPSIAAVVVAATAFMSTPQLMVAIQGGIMHSTGADFASVASNEIITATPSVEGLVLRDPSIDDYLLAHQRFSPSVYSTAQYARPVSSSNK